MNRLDIKENAKIEHNPLDAVILRGKEEILETWCASAQVVSSIAINDAPVKTWATLTILITNLRLIAIREVGLLDANFDLFTEMGLESISGVSIREVLFQKFVIINYRAQGGTAELALAGLDDRIGADKEASPNPFKPTDEKPLAMFVRSLDKAVRKRLHEVELEKNRERTVFDFGALRDQMANGGIVVTSVKCPNCGANLDLPETGDTVRCEYCGSRIHAFDLLQKLKELLAP
ncbi:MAG: hypothetical protein LUO79_04365 [Methanomassiliicoccales archaeon]|nr:hypothetical protein [Methanomassiliicoccales archaeon]